MKQRLLNKCILNVLVGSLDAPNQTFLVDCYPLDSSSNVISSIILHMVDICACRQLSSINVLVGSLDAPNQTFLVDCYPLDSSSNVISSIILHMVDNILRLLEIKPKNFSMFLTDADRYMSSAGKTLKKLYPFLMHVNCVAHLLHNCAMHVRAHFKHVDEVIATIKAATIKNKDR